MANFSVSLTVPNDKVGELVDALNWAWGEKDNGDGTTTPKTAAELKAELKARSKKSLKDVYLRYKEHLRNIQSVEGDIDIT